MRPSNRDIGDLTESLRGALAAVDSAGRLPENDARAIRAGLERLGTGASAPRFPELEKILGPFEGLPPAVQRSLVHEIEEDERWRMRGIDLGAAHHAAVRLVRNRRYRRLAPGLADTSVLLLRDGPRKVFYSFYEAGARWRSRHTSRPSAGQLLRAAGLDPRSLIAYYARGLVQRPRYRGFWHDPERNITVGSLLGVDLVPAPDGLWYLESNLNAAMRPARTALYENEDPLTVNLSDFARERGYRRLVIVLPNNQRVDPVMARRYEETAAARKIRLTLLEDAFLHRKRYDQTFGVPEALEPDTLVVRTKQFRTNLDSLFHRKTESHRALRIYQERSGDRDVRLAPTSDSPLASEYDPKQPFPNLVYKMPDLDRGTGIVFLKSSSLENARQLVSREIETRSAGWRERLHRSVGDLHDDHLGVFQPYLVGRMLEGRRLYYVRAHVFLTPVGVQYLSAHRIVGSTPVPQELPDGIVRDRSPYFWKFVTGATFALVSPEEESRVVKAALGVARGLSAAAAHGFQTGPSSR